MSEKMIHVHFIDDRTGEIFARVDLPLDELPERFDRLTTLHIGDDEWNVVKADPVAAVEFKLSGMLNLRLSKVEYVLPKAILFSLPTICDDMPHIEVRDDIDHSTCFRMHEDDWRQIELVSRRLTPVIDEELNDIDRIYTESRVVSGEYYAFKTMHVRRRIPAPIEADLPFSDFVSRLPATATAYGGLDLFTEKMTIEGGFAYNAGGLVLYGQQDGGRVSVLGLDTRFLSDQAEKSGLVGLLFGLMRDYDLVLLDWCPCLCFPIDEKSIDYYLSGKIG